MGYITGLYQGIKAFVIPYFNEQAGIYADSLLDDFKVLGFADRILSIIPFPRVFFTWTYEESHWVLNTKEPINIPQYIGRPDNIGGYYPRNKKLLTYPYIYLSVDAINDQKSYKWELGLDGVLSFNLYGIIGMESAILIVPIYYDKITNNSTEQIVVKGFSELPYFCESLVELFGSNGLVNKMTSIGASLALGSFNPNRQIAGVSDVTSSASGKSNVVTISSDNVRNTTSRFDRTTTQKSTDNLAKLRYDNDIAMKGAEQVISSVEGQMNFKTSRGGSVNYNIASKTQSIFFKTMGIRSSYAEKIDKFFDMYGYATNRVKVPNVNFRPSWNYVKTRGCLISGNVPASVMGEIEEIFDSGIRFWKVDGATAYVGDYNRPNGV